MFHKILGKIGAVLALLVFILGFKVAIGSVKNAPPDIMLWNLTLKQFMALPIINITLFAIYVSIGLMYRKKPEIHRPLILVATLNSILAAVDRYIPLVTLYQHTIFGAIWGPYFFAVIYGLLFLVIHFILTRSFDRYFAISWAIFSVIGVFVMRFATTSVWDGIATFLLQF